MGAHPCQLYPLGKGFVGTLPQSGMVHLIIDLVGILTKPCGKSLQGPDRQTPRINLPRHLAWTFCRLGIARQLVQELSCGSSKEPLDYGTHTWLCRRAIFFRDKIPCEQGFKVD